MSLVGSDFRIVKTSAKLAGPRRLVLCTVFSTTLELQHRHRAILDLAFLVHSNDVKACITQATHLLNSTVYNRDCNGTYMELYNHRT